MYELLAKKSHFHVSVFSSTEKTNQDFRKLKKKKKSKTPGQGLEHSSDIIKIFFEP